MQVVDRVSVVGLGPMGRTYLQRFIDSGIVARGMQAEDVASSSFTKGDLVLLALRSGIDALQAMLDMKEHGVSAIWNLTTQAIHDTRECSALAASMGTSYYGGGITGGVADVAAGRAMVLIGPLPTPEISSMVFLVGKIMAYPDAATATAAKLLHNLVLVIHNHVIAASLQLASLSGIGHFDSVLDTGTAGRKPSESSAARDYCDQPRTSYTSTLVAKDIKALLTSFPVLRRLDGIDLEALATFYDKGGSAPYTARAFQLLGEER